MTTTSPTTEHAAAALDPAAWCRDRARNYRYYEESELAMYPSNDHRDASLVEWTVRALGNADLEDSPRLLAVIAAQHHMELNPTGTAEWLKAKVAELKAELDKTRAALTHANRELAGTRADHASAVKANTAWANGALTADEQQRAANAIKAYIRLCGSRIESDHPYHAIAAKLAKGATEAVTA